jgi:hypothetical protein
MTITTRKKAGVLSFFPVLFTGLLRGVFDFAAISVYKGKIILVRYTNL